MKLFYIAKMQYCYIYAFIMKPEAVFKTLEESDVVAIDVRTPKEFESVNIEGSVNVPLDQIKKSSFISELPKEKELILVCRSGQRAGVAQKDLEVIGFSNTQVVEGGVMAWEKAGLPVNKGMQTMSLERQVRIAAGFLVLVGALLGLFVHSVFFGIPVFVGAGLMFAGITDTCAMGMMIAKMPWNSSSSCEVCKG